MFDADGNSLIPPCNIYNVDETGFNICQKSRKIVAKKGEKSVGILTSAEKSKNVTMVGCVSASGHYVLLRCGCGDVTVCGHGAPPEIGLEHCLGNRSYIHKAIN